MAGAVVTVKPRTMVFSTPYAANCAKAWTYWFLSLCKKDYVFTERNGVPFFTGEELQLTMHRQISVLLSPYLPVLTLIQCVAVSPYLPVLTLIQCVAV